MSLLFRPVIFIMLLLLVVEGKSQSRAIKLKILLQQLEEKYQVTFMYPSEAGDKVVNAAIDNALVTVEDQLKNILKGSSLVYKKIDTKLYAILKPDSVQEKKASPAGSSGVEREVKGVVKSAHGETLPGANVVEKGTSHGTVTGAEGEFSLVVNDPATLLVSSIGFQTQEIAVDNRSTFEVTLLEEVTQLQEVEVHSYGLTNKRDLAGSIVKISGKEVENTPNPNPISSLQGKVTGLSIVNDGKPGAIPDIRIRGTVSINQTSPLYVVDGIFADNISFLNPTDIESLEVLKDPSSLAIYGVRGANGVIIITTKKGKEGQAVIHFSSSYGAKSIVNIPKITNRSGFMTLYDEQRLNQRISPYARYGLYTADTDWIRTIAADNPTISMTNFSVSNGTDKNKFYTGFGYIKETGLIKNEDYKKITLSVSDEYKYNNRIKAGFDISGYYASLPQTHDFELALKAPPIVAPYNEAGGLYNKLPEGLGASDVANPLQQVNEINNRTQVAGEYNMRGSLFLEIEVLKKLTFRSNWYANLYNKDQVNYKPVHYVYNMETQRADTINRLSSLDVYKNSAVKYQQEYLLTYKNQFGDHGFTLLGGFTTYYEYSNYLRGNVRQKIGGEPIPNDKRWWYLGVFPYGDSESRTGNSGQYERATLSFLFRTLYNYKGRYNLNLSYRRDGSSAISPNHRFQNFWAVGAAWYLNEESFMKDSFFFDVLKLKGSVGQLGNQYTAGTGTSSSLNTSGTDENLNYPYYPNYINGPVAAFGNNLIPALVLAYRNNPDLRWETVTAYEGGVEMDVLKTRLHLEANYYNRKTNDLLTKVDDGSEKFYTNAGSISSSGIELAANWNAAIRKKFQYSVGANITTINSKVLSVWRPGYVYTDGPRGQSRTEEGNPIGAFYGYQVTGIDEKGNLRFQDRKNDGQISDADRTFIGNPTPKFTYGCNFSVNYYDFDLAVALQGVYGNQVWRDWGNEGSGNNIYNFRQARLNRWTTDKESNTEPQENTSVAQNTWNSVYMIESGSYMRIRNIQLGYSLRSEVLQRLHARTVRLYVSAQNPVTWKKNSGFTPEATGTALRFGIDNGGYPLPAIYSIGLNFTF